MLQKVACTPYTWRCPARGERQWGGNAEEKQEEVGRHRCLVKPLVDRVMHTASSSTDLASDGYELERDVTAENSLDSRAAH